MPHLAHITLVVRDYDEALAFYVGKLGFDLVEDTYQPEQDKRWVTIRPPGAPPDTATSLGVHVPTPSRSPASMARLTGELPSLFQASVV